MLKCNCEVGVDGEVCEKLLFLGFVVKYLVVGLGLLLVSRVGRYKEGLNRVEESEEKLEFSEYFCVCFLLYRFLNF